MIQNFRSYALAVQLYRDCREIRLAAHLKDQLLRAASSVVLNLSEGSAKPSVADRKRFYSIAFGSLREVQALIELDDNLINLRKPADVLAAHVYKLTRS